MYLNLTFRWNHFWCKILGHTGDWWYVPECNRCGLGYNEVKKEIQESKRK